MLALHAKGLVIITSAKVGVMSISGPAGLAQLRSVAVYPVIDADGSGAQEREVSPKVALETELQLTVNEVGTF